MTGTLASMKRKLALTGVLVASLGLVACAAGEAEPAESTAAPTQASGPTPTESAGAGTYEFGETATIDYAGSVWAVTIQAPVDADPSLAEGFPLDDPESRYVEVPGTVARVDGEPAEPITEVEIGVVVDNRSIEAEYLSSDGVPPLPAVEELFAGGEAPFAEIFAVPGGAEVRTVSVIVGVGEAGQRVFFGDPVDTGQDTASASTPDVESMIYLWNEASSEERATTLEGLGLSPGSEVTADAVAQLVTEANERGIILDDAEAREFLEWAVAQ